MLWNKTNIIQLLYMDENVNNITKLYDKLNYFDQYGGSLILFIIITIAVILSISYFYTMANIQPIINDWPNQRCKPTIMPFAGLITHPDDMSASEYTQQNFTYCTQNILSNITGYAVQPLTHITNMMQNSANTVQNSIQSTRAMFDKIRTSMQTVSEEIMGRLMNIMIPLMQMIISFKDLTGKVQGTMTSGLFTLLGSYYTLKSLMGAIAQFIIAILIALSVMVAAFWIFPFTWGAAMANTAIFVAIAVPMSIILAFMNDILHVNAGYKIPKIKCFDKNTLIEMNDRTKKKIIDIQTGDILSNNNKVTATFKVSTEGSDIYVLDDIIVSDSHIVKYKNIWIPVSEHPNAIKFERYDEPFLYCLNTSKKVIEINNTTFTDWDEIYDKSLDALLTNKLIPMKNCKDIHKCLDRGFISSTKIKLANKSYKEINKINIGDVLENGEIVYGVVEIDGSDLNRNILHNLGENDNIHECASKSSIINQQIITNKKKLYHLLTDKKTIKLGNVVISDYNAAIDKFLEILI